MLRCRLTIVLTAITWSASVAWRIPRKNPMVATLTTSSINLPLSALRHFIADLFDVHETRSATSDRSDEGIGASRLLDAVAPISTLWCRTYHRAIPLGCGTWFNHPSDIVPDSQFLKEGIHVIEKNGNRYGSVARDWCGASQGGRECGRQRRGHIPQCQSVFGGITESGPRRR